MRVAELSGVQLDYWVARAEGLSARIEDWGIGPICATGGPLVFNPSEDWALGGPIIDKQLPELMPCWPAGGWYARSRHRPCDGDQYFGETALIAAMRAFVASKYGEEVPAK